jgi:hypothetical protein
MKYKIIFVILFFIGTKMAEAQSTNGNAAQSTNGNAAQIAQKIAKKMKDSLSLTGNQKSKIYDVNMRLHNKKQIARNETVNNPVLLATKIQNIEKTRDSLYKPILTVPQFDLYKIKKRNLVNNN